MLSLQKIEPSKLDTELLEFGPIECLECGFEDEIPVEYYLIKSKHDDDFEFLDKIVKKQTGYNQFTQMCSNFGDIVSVCKCPKCNSEEIFQDL